MPETGILRCGFEEFMEADDLRQQQKEETLQEQRRQIRSELAGCDAWYEEECRTLEEEKECQESSYTPLG